MSSFADTYGTPGIVDQGETTQMATLSILDLESVGSGVWLSGLVVLSLVADTTAVTVAILRTGPGTRSVKSVTYALPAAVTDSYTAAFGIEGFDGPGVVSEVDYDLAVECVNASDDTSVLVNNLHARYNDPAPLPQPV